ncbi:hypothetical protein KP509_14G055000 [Ceratopteris richardii]|uniref:FHA domain-containing protein n=1 Tax=Ceratopteris richardii TaxID=49495 RepID=A0A8T2T9Y6_CERRI|nr:hypothetical protein KP509_14G055000 [Ceratopteris richardii]
MNLDSQPLYRPVASRKWNLVGAAHRFNQRTQLIRASLSETSIQEEAIKKELRREEEKITRQLEEEAARKQHANDKARKEMREWWIEKWEAKKRSEGWGGYEKCWVLRAIDPNESHLAVISGEGILLGAAPLAYGTIKPFVVDFPMVSSVHAHVYGKDVVKGYKKYVREYFVVDLGSTNGTYLNRSKLRPRTEVRLKKGDVLKFGDERATFIVEFQS